MATVIFPTDTHHRIIHQLADAVGQGKFDLWFRSAELSINEDTIHVAAPNRFVADWIDRNFREQMRGVARAELGDAASVRVEVGAAAENGRTSPAPAAGRMDSPADPPAEPAPPTAPPTLRRTGSPGRPAALKYDLAEFVVGASNELAYTAAHRLVDEPDCQMNPLFIHGGCGLGKTHLLQGLCRRFVRQQPSANWCYTTAEEFTNRYIHAVRKNKLADFRRRLRRLDLLAVDDVHFLANKSATQTEFLHTFDAIDLHGSKLVLASDAHPKLIEQLGDALVSRFMSGMVVQVTPPDAATRVRLIDALARRRGMNLMDGVADVLANHGERSVREIEGMLTKLSALASLTGQGSAGDQPIGHALVHRLIGAAEAERKPVRLEQILRVVCEDLHVERAQVFSRGRHRRVVLARSVVVFLARQLTTLSYPELARALGRPNHSTIVTAHQRTDQQVRDRRAVPGLDMPQADTMDRLVDHLRRRAIDAANRSAE